MDGGMTDLIRRKQAGEAWETAVDAGGSTAGAGRVLGPFPFTYDDPALNDPGIEFYTPTIGDILLDAWISVETYFDGTTPRADIGVVTGIYAAGWGPFNVADADSEVTEGLLSHKTTSSPNASVGSNVSALNSMTNGDPNMRFVRFLPAVFQLADPLKVWVSQTGSHGPGSDSVGGTQGAGAVYLIVATPSLT